jgi:hypothetical protein
MPIKTEKMSENIIRAQSLAVTMINIDSHTFTMGDFLKTSRSIGNCW